MKANKLKDLTWLFFINIFISSFTFGGGYVVVSMVRKYFVEKRKIFNESDLNNTWSNRNQSCGISWL